MSATPPTPSFNFTIPSLHDDLDLDCRIYNPQHSSFNSSANDTPWHPRGAVVAHPYAPLGGCYDDPIVLVVVEECLKKGLVVSTFNFRGAPGSKSSTSWTSKPEVNDYISAAGMLIHYLRTLSSSLSPFPTPPSDMHLTPVPSNTLVPPSPSLSLPPSLSKPINLLLSGYSYGSLITTLLPPDDQILRPFTHPPPSSAAAEILARAHSLALQTVKELTDPPHRGRKQSQIAIGGEEGPPGTRLSRDHSRKSIDAVRRSVEHTRQSFERSRRRLIKRSSGGQGGGNSTTEGAAAEDQAPTLPSPLTGLQGPQLEIRYLLISPLLGPIAGLATLSLSTLLRSFTPHSSHSQSQPTIHSPTTNATLTCNPTLVIYGTNDSFTSAKRLRKWCAALKMQSNGDLFASREVEGAGHFWREHGAEGVLRTGLEGWLDGTKEKEAKDTVS